MKHYHYLGHADEIVPKDVTHITVHPDARLIRKRAFLNCIYLVSIICHNQVTRIEEEAFAWCLSLRYVRLSLTLEFIGTMAFYECTGLKGLFIPQSVKTIENQSFQHCYTLRLMLVPTGSDDVVDLGLGLVFRARISQMALSSGAGLALAYHCKMDEDGDEEMTDKSNNAVNSWLAHHMDDYPLHRLCYDSNVSALKINQYFNVVNCDDTDVRAASSVGQREEHNQMTPVHVLAMNPHAPPDAFLALLRSRGSVCGAHEDASVDANADVDTTLPLSLPLAFALTRDIPNQRCDLMNDDEGMNALEYAAQYNVDGLIAMTTALCMHALSTS